MKYAALFCSIMVLGCLIGDTPENPEMPDEDVFIKEYLELQRLNNKEAKTTTTYMPQAPEKTTTTSYQFTDRDIEAARGRHIPPTTTTTISTTSSTTTTTSPCLSHCSEIRIPSPENCKAGCCYSEGQECLYFPGNIKSGGSPRCSCM
jgi:hypothetical protein